MRIIYQVKKMGVCHNDLERKLTCVLYPLRLKTSLICLEYQDYYETHSIFTFSDCSQPIMPGKSFIDYRLS